MKELIDKLPQYLIQLLQEQKIEVSDIELIAKGDMNLRGEFSESYVIAANRKLVIAVDEKLQIYPMEKLEKLKCERLNSVNVLVGEIEGQDKLLLMYSLSVSNEFGVFTKLFTKLKEEKEITKEELEEQTKKKEDHKKIDKKSIFLRVLSYGLRYKLDIFFILLFMLLSSMLNLFLPYYSGNVFFDKVLKTHGEFFGKIGLFIVIMFAVKLTSTALGIGYGRVNASFAAKLIFSIKVDVFNALQRLSLSFYNNRQTGMLMNNVNGDSRQLQGFFLDGVPYFVQNIITIIGIFIVMINLNWKLTIFAFIPIPIIVAVFKYMFPRLWKLFSRTFKWGSKMNSVIIDSLQGSRVVKAFGKENDEIKHFSQVNKQFYNVDVDAGNLEQTVFPLAFLLMGVSGILIWGYGSILVIRKEITFGTLITFTGYVTMLMDPLRFMSQVAQWWSNCMNSASRIFEIMDTVPEVQEKDNAVAMENMRGEIELKNVSFEYEPNNPVLHEINLKIKPGEMLGLVGHSGAGKSTIINVISRLYDVNEGEICIDGVNVKDIRLKHLHSQIGLVLQDVSLFMGTIAENIAYAKPGASMEEIIEASKVANAHDFIMKLPDGYDTLIGSRGQRLSGGEKQRISIARAVLLDPKILILDEATASLDTETERLIQDALDRLVKGRTTISIAHRLSTLRNADRIVVVEKGKVEEIGTHKELVKLKGIYYRLLQKQKEALKLQGVE